ncbi:unnamed protein product [Fusarium venenatum]|uniref:Uncharacterized protein n=1 Tax=Fusarium venenatum TaxID=56646 RepID=A0A2L2T7H9_9HYPO|nr:uncharacterized protein FVRRES_05547 [Fusarium venenatum]CEI61111.1 unnamed protein product [Fusarium venenatum]
MTRIHRWSLIETTDTIKRGQSKITACAAGDGGAINKRLRYPTGKLLAICSGSEKVHKPQKNYTFDRYGKNRLPLSSSTPIRVRTSCRNLPLTLTLPANVAALDTGPESSNSSSQGRLG